MTTERHPAHGVFRIGGRDPWRFLVGSVAGTSAILGAAGIAAITTRMVDGSQSIGSGSVLVAELIVLVVVPLTVAAWYAAVGDPRAPIAALAAGATLLVWAVVAATVHTNYLQYASYAALGAVVLAIAGNMRHRS